MNVADRKDNSAGNESRLYQIRIRGHIRSEWEEWFWGFMIAQIEDGDTLITGTVQDQAELFGLLRRIRDLGLPLISLTRIDSLEEDESDDGAK